jgi:hypothetical protein
MSFDLTGYVDVAERIRMFKEKYPNGSLQPLDHSKPFDVMAVGERMFVVYVAAAYRTPDDQRPGVGMAWEPYPGKSTFTRDSELMNAETSAWGRAIIAALAAETQKIASADEVRNRQAPQEDADVIPMPTKATPRSYPSEKPSPAGSREEMIASAERKSQTMKATATSATISEAQANLLAKLAKEKQVDLLDFVAEHAGRQVDNVNALTKKEASNVISLLMNKKEVL